MQQLKSKYPGRVVKVSDSVAQAEPLLHLKGLHQSLKALDKGVSPGTGGLRPEYLVTLAEVMDGGKMSFLEEFGLKYLGGQLPPWFYCVWLSVNTV